MSTKISDTSVTSEPVFYITVFFFVLLTTALPAGLGQFRWMPILQTISLSIFLIMVLRLGKTRRALQVCAIWLPIQFGALLLITWLLPAQAQQAIPSGFDRGVALLEWLYADSPLPASLLSQPAARWLEVLGVLLGSLLTGGIVGIWFLMRATNLAGFFSGVLLATSGDPAGFLAMLLPWTLLRLAGYTGFVILLAEPLLTGNWRPAHYLTHRRGLLLASAGLLVLALILEWVLPAPWRAFFSTILAG
jgi:hypothetical protein